jgi:hypothetical protein
MNIHHNSKVFFKKHRFMLILIFLLTGLLFALPACNENSGDIINSNSNDNIGVGFYSEQQGDNNLIEITEAKFLLRKLTLKPAEGGDESEVKLGPFVVYLDLSPRVVLVGLAKIPFGVYDEIKFQVHKPNPNENIPDPDFFHSTSIRYSVVAKGFYNGVPFDYRSSVTVAKEIEFENYPVTVAAPPEMVYVTVSVSPFSWFINNGVILDPNDENNKHEIDRNIKNSLKRAFRDMNLDGHPD